MSPKEPPKLDLNSTYPCPSCKQGSLIPITLTEAWGCDRCKQIFELQSDPNTVSKLANPYHHKRLWKWDGHQWMTNNPLLKPILPVSYIWAGLIFVLALFWLGWTLLALTGLSQPVRVALIVLLIVMSWVVLRR